MYPIPQDKIAKAEALVRWLMELPDRDSDNIVNMAYGYYSRLI